MAVSPQQMQFYLEAGHTPWVHQVCETGFNGGHSAIALLYGNSNSSLTSFDLMDKSFQPAAMALFKSIFGEHRVQFVAGDSTKTVPAHLPRNGFCQLFSVDGGHSYEVATADIINFQRLSDCDNIVLMDDIFQKYADTWNVHHVDGAMNAWVNAVSSNKIKQFGCYEYFINIENYFGGIFVDSGVGSWKKVPRAFCVGTFASLPSCPPSKKAENRALEILKMMDLTPCAKSGCN
jgi:hypothetical protein